MSIFKKEDNATLQTRLVECAKAEQSAATVREATFDWLIGKGVTSEKMLLVGTAKNDPKNPVTVDTIQTVTQAMFLATTSKEDVKLSRMAKDDPRLSEEDRVRRQDILASKGSKMKDFRGAFRTWLNKQAGKGAGGSRRANSFEDRHKKASADMTKAVTAAEKATDNAERESYDADLMKQYRADLAALDTLAAKIEKSKVLPTEK